MPLLSGDRKLLRRFRRGEAEALAQVYDAYVSGIAAFLTRGFTFKSKGRLLQFRGYHQPFDLDNALQETFARAFSERARLAYDGLNPFKSYVTAIARNLVLSELRRREVAMSQLVGIRDGQEVEATAESLEAAEAVSAAAPAPSAEAQYMRQELLKLYHAFNDSLDPRDGAFFVARFEEQLTQVEAGKSAGLSHMQARTLEKKLRRRFLSFMQSHGYLDAYRRGAPAVA